MNTDITQEDIAAFHTSHPDDNIIPAQVQMPRMVRQIGVNTVATKNDVSVTESGISKQFFIHHYDDGRISGMVISKITTRNRHVSSNNSTNSDGEIGYNSTIEVNSHSNTYFFGKNWQTMSSTEQVWSVTAFLDKISTTINVTIVTAAIAMVDDNGTVFIAVFGQGINYTKKMYKGIMNPNQCRSFGVHFFDNSTGPTRKLVFYANNVFLPLRMQETNFLGDSFFSSYEELWQFPWVFLSGEKSCDPFNVTCPTISTMYQTMKEESDPVGSKSNQTLCISNEAIYGMNMSNINARMVKAVNISQEWNEVKDFTTEILNVHPPTHPEFLIR